MNKYIKHPGILAAAVMAVLAAVLLLMHQPYLLRIEGQSLFLPTVEYYQSCLELPGGILMWVATLLTQFFYLPWLGSLVYAGVCALTCWLTIRAFSLKGCSSAMGVVPSAMALLSLLGLGYLIFSIKSPGVAYTPILGFAFVSAVFWGFRSIPCHWGRMVALPFMVVAFYTCSGAYALFAALLCVVHELMHIKESKLISAVTVVVGIIAIVTWPYVWLQLVGGILQHTDIYTVMLPRYHGDEWLQWVPFIITAVFMLVSCICLGRWVGESRAACIVSLSVSVLAMAAPAVFAYDDPNFDNMLKMQAAIDSQQWQQVVEIDAAASTEPTRLNSMLTEIALMNLGSAPEMMYALPYGDADYHTTRAERALHDVAAALICYQWGQVNYATRWATEMKVEYGCKADYLKLLAKCALLTGEYDQARKYLHTLSATLPHRSWAKKYLEYADNPALIDADPEMVRIRQLMHTPDHLGVDSGGFELFLRPLVANSAAQGDAAVEWAMQCALVAKDLNAFLRWLPQYMQKHKRLPRHFQEAVMVWCYVNDSDAYQSANIDPAVVSQFGQFVNAYQQYQRLTSEQQADAMRGAFGNTYWFYFVILDDLKFI